MPPLRSQKGGASAASAGGASAALGAAPMPPEPSLTVLEPSSSAARATIDRTVLEVCDILDGASRNGKVRRQAIAELMAEHPDKPHRDTAQDVVSWARREPLRSVAGAYRRALADRADERPAMGYDEAMGL